MEGWSGEDGLAERIAANEDKKGSSVRKVVTKREAERRKFELKIYLFCEKENYSSVEHLCCNKLAKLRRCVSWLSCGSKKFGPSKLLLRNNLEKVDKNWVKVEKRWFFAVGHNFQKIYDILWSTGALWQSRDSETQTHRKSVSVSTSTKMKREKRKYSQWGIWQKEEGFGSEVRMKNVSGKIYLIFKKCTILHPATE